MAEWMTIGELAEECRADVYALREALELLGLFDVGEPTPLAVRHSLATPEVDEQTPSDRVPIIAIDAQDDDWNDWQNWNSRS